MAKKKRITFSCSYVTEDWEWIESLFVWGAGNLIPMIIYSICSFGWIALSIKKISTARICC